MKKILKVFVGLLIVTSLPIAAQQASSLDELLQNVEQGKIQDTSDNQKKENEFRQKRGQQEVLLNESNATKVKEEDRSAKLEALFEENWLYNNELQNKLNDDESFELEELFFVVQQLAGNTKTRFATSLTNIQFPDRVLFLDELIKKTSSISIEEIERFWNELLREIKTSGEVIKFNTEVINKQGVVEKTEVVRVGQLSIITNGAYLTYEPETGKVREMQKQPKYIYTKTTMNFFDSNNKNAKVNFGIFLENNSKEIINASSVINSLSGELFFECKFVSGSNGTRANITFNKVSNTATVVTDLMMGPMLTHRADPALTADSLVVSFYPYLQADSKSNLIVNRDTLKMTGIRNGTCKIVEKKNSKF